LKDVQAPKKATATVQYVSKKNDLSKVKRTASMCE